MGLLIFVWDIYTELQNCMYQTTHGPLPFPITDDSIANERKIANLTPDFVDDHSIRLESEFLSPIFSSFDRSRNSL